MNKFKSFTELQEFVEQTRAEYSDQAETMLSDESNVNRFLVQLNTNLKNRGLEILKSEHSLVEGDVRAQIKYRLIKGGISQNRLEEYYKVIQKQIDGIEKDGK